MLSIFFLFGVWGFSASLGSKCIANALGKALYPVPKGQSTSNLSATLTPDATFVSAASCPYYSSPV